MSEPQLLQAETSATPRSGYRLQRLETFNWGTFDKRAWVFTTDGDTALLTGDIGSGKSTLVDAITTLLMPAHRISYNKAAGADSRERTLRSYVEGHYKSERHEATGTSRSTGLRVGAKTYSVILGVFYNEGYDETVSLAQVFQQRESTGQPYRFYVTARRNVSVSVDLSDFGTDLRDLRKRLRASGTEVFDEFPKYASSMRRLLGIRSEQALELFHQTVSMKSVGNLNDFVRGHMLEPSDSTQRVREIIAHFEDLTKAHDSVKRAREQLEVLEPLAGIAERYDGALRERDGSERARAAVQLFIAEKRSSFLAENIKGLEVDGQRLLTQRDFAEGELERLGEARESLIEERARSGGDRVGELERLATAARAEAQSRKENRGHFDDAVHDAGLQPILGREGFEKLSGTIGDLRPDLAEEDRDLGNSLNGIIARESKSETRGEQIGAELESLESRTSNIPAEQIDIRLQLCESLGLSPDNLPYAGELLDVFEEHSEWRGVAERVLRGFALSLLVPQQHYDRVTDWVNSRRLTVRRDSGRDVGSRLVYERVADRRIARPSVPDGQLLLADCLEIRRSPFEEFIFDELRARARHACATSLEEFRAQSWAVTREGQVRAGGRHEKDDRHRIDDAKRWVLGWANERKIAALRSEAAKLEEERLAAVAERKAVDDMRQGVQVRLRAFAKLEVYRSWAELDADEASTRARLHDEERERLVSGSTRLAEISRALERNKHESEAVSGRFNALTGEIATTAKAQELAKQAKERDDAFIEAQPEQARELARRSYPTLTERLGESRPIDADDCTSARDELSEELTKRIDRLGRELGGYGQSLAQAMGDVLRRWPELGAEMDAHVESRADFVAFRNRVAQDDLPRFESEFKEQLNKNAIQELAQFNNWLNRQAAAIDDRLLRINDALGAVPYNPGRYITLEKEPTTNQEIVQFRSDLRNLTNDSLAIGGDQYSEQRFLDVKRIIERFRGREGLAETDKAWTRRVTDVRSWFIFSASERDMATHVEWEHYSDSDGKSGGQKEKLAYTILAASLAYQFGLEWGATTSRDFRFAVIDEAFGRGSDASTRYALELFAKLGLQLLIVTPLQKVHIIEPYVKAIGFVDNPGGAGSRLSTMTIEDYRAGRAGARS